MNLSAGKTRKDTIYLWDFGNGDTFYGVNPLSHKFGFGNHAVTLKIFDTKTGDLREEVFHIVVEKLVIVKKTKEPKAIPVKAENPFSLK